MVQGKPGGGSKEGSKSLSFSFMSFIYIPCSLSAGKYYTGYTTDITVRLEKHNHQENFNTCTRKYRQILESPFSGGLEDNAVSGTW
ncbi:MAG: GIY-YIG nuclease family protein [Chitinophagaceae bacterium]|nr:GIY-YIG nuclease family protein [Chitinophagaceae bacterium]MCW5925550.1 GIY-YIG nuclease family protein [Chitinophagaceae bacterium]